MEKRSTIIIVLLFLYATSFAQNFNINTLKKLNVERNKSLDNFFCGISNTITYTSLATPITYYTIGLIKKDSNLQKHAFTNIMALGINSVVTIALKRGINKPRPAVTYPYLTPLENLSNYSMPSGHTSLAFANATNIAIVGKKWYYIAPAFTYASLVAYSRLHMGVHYPSDVFVGALVGSGSAYLAHILNKKLQRKSPYNKLVGKFIF